MDSPHADPPQRPPRPRPTGPPPQAPPPRPRVFNLWALMLALFVGYHLWATFGAGAPVRLAYSEFLVALDERRLDDLAVGPDEITGTLRDTDSGETRRFVTLRVDEELAERLGQHDVEYTGAPPSVGFGEVLLWLLPILVLVLFWGWMLRRMAGGGGPGGGFMSVGKSKARIYVEESVKVSFADVAGVDEAKDELKEIIQFLHDPKRYGRLGARLPKGILLVGPPGTGKTLLARAVAGEAGVPFFSISGSEFVEMFVGVGAARVRDLFDQARQKAPCIIFIDELDALGRARGMGPMGGGHDEKEQPLNQLLAELDGFDPSAGVVLLAATNRPEILDAALLRAGRFDRQILVDRPDKPAREAILTVHLLKIDLDTDVDAAEVAALTPGFTGADLANLVNEAALLATRRGADSVTRHDFTAALERIVAGLEKRTRLLNPHERKVTAYHEIGHALVARAIPGCDPVHKVSIIPRGIGSLGYTIQRPTEDRFLMSRGELEDKLAVLLGGRAAEDLVFDEVSTGAADDLAKATNIARSMVTRYGMHADLGLVAYDDEPSRFLGTPAEALWNRPRSYSEETAREIDCAVRDLVGRAFQRARGLLQRHRAQLVDTAERLLEKETLDGDELPRLADDVEAGGGAQA